MFSKSNQMFSYLLRFIKFLRRREIIKIYRQKVFFSLSLHQLAEMEMEKVQPSVPIKQRKDWSHQNWDDFKNKLNTRWARWNSPGAAMKIQDWRYLILEAVLEISMILILKIFYIWYWTPIIGNIENMQLMKINEIFGIMGIFELWYIEDISYF